MRLFFIACLSLVFVGCKSNKNEKVSQEKINSENKFDSVILNNIEKIQVAKVDYIDSKQLEKIYSKIGVWEIHGNEPFWSIKIINDKIIFTKLNENIDTVYFKVIDFLFIDNGISFELKDINNEKAFLNIFKRAEKVSDGMSDNLYNFSARLKYDDIELKGVAEKIK